MQRRALDETRTLTDQNERGSDNNMTAGCPLHRMIRRPRLPRQVSTASFFGSIAELSERRGRLLLLGAMIDLLRDPIAAGLNRADERDQHQHDGDHHGRLKALIPVADREVA